MIITKNKKKVKKWRKKNQKAIDNDKKWRYNLDQDFVASKNDVKSYTPPQPFTLSTYGGGIFQRKENAMSKLRGYRVMLGLTQQQMADKLEISLQSYNNKETKKTPFNDKERLAIKSMVAEIKPDITIDELFYS